VANVALITAIYDSYDGLKPVMPQVGVDAEWIVVTDSTPHAELAEGWTIVHEPRPGVHPNRAAKHPKYEPWKYTDAPVSIWVDASFRVVSDRFAVEAVAGLTDEEPIAQFAHPWRDCAPGDQKVRTVKHGEVRIDELIPGVHRLVSYWPLYRRLVFGRNRHGYDFERAVRDFTGDLVVMTTNHTRVRVTPNHWVAARWTPDAKTAYCVYLMRRGSWWRIGKSQLHNGDARRFGPAGRARTEEAADVWLLGVYESNGEALLAEQFLSAAYGISQAIFTNKGVKSMWQCHVTNEMLKDLHERLAARGSGERARQLLSDLGLDVSQPIWTRGSNNFPGLGASAALKIRAGNLVSGWMEVPVADGANVTWERVTTSRESVVGMPVYSLNVEPYHSYVGDGQVLYNCIYSEARESAGLAKYAGEPVLEQAESYRQAGHPENWGLWATGVIARQHTEAVRKMGWLWLAETYRWSFQDQISQPFALRENGLRPTAFPGNHLATPWLAYEGSARH
jgi:hypothetical protein